jgi:hypothetical protein
MKPFPMLGLAAAVMMVAAGRQRMDFANIVTALLPASMMHGLCEKHQQPLPCIW